MMLSAVRHDGRSEDDVLLVGLFQADDAYLLPTVGAHKSRRRSAVCRRTFSDVIKPAIC